MQSKFFLCLLVIFSFGAKAQSRADLIGTWEGIDSVNNSGELKITDSTHLVMYILNSGTFNATYIVDLTKDPMWFDITISDSAKTAILHGLLKFLDPNTLKWQIFINRERPLDFVDEKENNTIVLTRQE